MEMDGKRLDSVECNFVNIMKPDTEYLVFISCLASSLDEVLPSYQLYDKQIIAPVFCYEKSANTRMWICRSHCVWLRIWKISFVCFHAKKVEKKRMEPKIIQKTF